LKDETIQSLAAAILRQLADQCAVFPESVTALYNLHQANGMPLRFEEISSALTEVLQMFSQVFLIVDALDECSEQTRRELLSYLQEQQKRTKIKLLVTSRPTINVQQEFDDCEILEIRADEQDVKIVLGSLIERLPTFIRTDEMLRNRVKDDIAAAVDGMCVQIPSNCLMFYSRTDGFIQVCSCRAILGFATGRTINRRSRGCSHSPHEQYG
jgi:hypothetical protein